MFFSQWYVMLEPVAQVTVSTGVVGSVTSVTDVSEGDEETYASIDC